MEASLILKAGIPFVTVLFGFAQIPADATSSFLNDLIGHLVLLAGRIVEVVLAALAAVDLLRRIAATIRDFYLRFFG